jgi:hypothetical protein
MTEPMSIAEVGAGNRGRHGRRRHPRPLPLRTGPRIARPCYHLLLEKPIATTPEQCDDIVEAAERAGATFAPRDVIRAVQPDVAALARLGCGRGAGPGRASRADRLVALRTLVRPRQQAA